MSDFLSPAINARIKEKNMESKIVKCFGDSQQYDGGWFAEYDGKWIDVTNDVQNVLQLFLDTIEKAKPEECTLKGRETTNFNAGFNSAIRSFTDHLVKEIKK